VNRPKWLCSELTQARIAGNPEPDQPSGIESHFGSTIRAKWGGFHMTDSITDIDRNTIAGDLRELLAGHRPQEVIDSAVAHFSSASETAATTAYPANGSVASLIVYTKCQCTIKNGGKTFNGSAWGVTFPGGGALMGDVYTDDINKLYAQTSSFTLVATPVYTTFIFTDSNGNTLGSFQAGAVSTVGGVGGGGGNWS
jgi:hypothetical protein